MPRARVELSDARVVELLQEKGRLNTTELAKYFRMRYGDMRDALRAMERRGVICGYVVSRGNQWYLPLLGALPAQMQTTPVERAAAQAAAHPYTVVWSGRGPLPGFEDREGMHSALTSASTVGGYGGKSGGED